VPPEVPVIFAKLAVEVYSHPRFVEAGYEASGYWMHALAYLRHQESSNGFLADRVITMPLGGQRAKCRKLCDKLVSVGLFQRVEGGYLLLRYADKNETKEVIENHRAASRYRQATLRRERAGGEPLSSSLDGSLGTLEEGGVTANAPCAVTSPPVSEIAPSLSPSLSSLKILREGESEGPAPPAARSGPAEGARAALPRSERRLNGSLWVGAFTEGISQQTGRPCSVGRYFLETLERIVTHHAPDRGAPAACAWIREQAMTFAAQWDGKNPPKGLTPDGLERWLNDGRRGPVQWRGRAVQSASATWRPEDFTDAGTTVVHYGDPTKGTP
jgi:hypothetical protein